MTRESVPESKSSIDEIIGNSRAARETLTDETISRLLKAQPGADPALRVLNVRSVGESGGASSGSLVFDVETTGDTKRYLAKFDPRSAMAPFHQYDMGAQFQVQKALFDFGVKTPEPICADPTGNLLGAPGYIMEFVPGESPAASAYTNGLMADAPPHRRTAMTKEAISALASMHDVDPASSGLTFLTDRAKGSTSVERELNWIMDMCRYNLMEDERINRACRRLLSRQVSEAPDTLIHGDSKFDNFIFVGDKVVAIIDFENATIAPREHDLAYNVFTSECMSWGLKRPDGFLSADEICAAYESVSGYQLQHWEYFLDLNIFKFSAFILSYTSRMPGVQEKAPDFYSHFWDRIEQIAG